MDILLIGGAPSTGKSTVLYRLAHRLVATGRYALSAPYAFAPTLPLLYEPFRIKEDLHIGDEMFFLKGANAGGVKKNILVNMATDDLACIASLMAEIRRISQSDRIDVLVTSIRCPIDTMRTELTDQLGITGRLPLEVPLGKKHWGPGIHDWLDWYLVSMDRLVDHNLRNAPYEI